MKLYDYPPSLNGWKVRALLRLLGRHIDTCEVAIFEGESHTAEFFAKNLMGAVPVLEFDDGRCIAESNAILIYLAHNTSYLPSDPAAQAAVLQWLFFEQNYVECVIGSLRHWVLTGKLARRDPAVVARHRAVGNHVLDRLEAWLSARDFLAENRFTLADLAVYAYTHRAEDAGFELASRSHFRDWIDRIVAQGPLPEVVPYSVDPYSGRDL